MYLKFFSGFCFMMLFSASLFAQDYISLKYQFEKGDRYQIHQKKNQETYITLNGVPQRTSSDKNTEMLLTLKSIMPDGSAVFDAEYKKMSLFSSQKNIEMSVNTETDEADKFNRMFKALINKKFQIILDPQGNIKEVTGMDAILDDMIATLPKVKKKEEQTLKDFLDEQLGANQIKADFSLILPFYPSRKIRTGDSWTSHLAAKGLYNGQIDNYWEMVFGTKYMVKLENNGKFNTDPNEVVDLGDGQEGRMELDGDIEGQYVIDPSTSWPSRSIVHTELNGTFIFYLTKGRKKKKKGELKAPVRVVQNASYEIKHL